jgi:hypothetical protein
VINTNKFTKGSEKQNQRNKYIRSTYLSINVVNDSYLRGFKKNDNIFCFNYFHFQEFLHLFSMCINFTQELFIGHSGKFFLLIYYFLITLYPCCLLESKMISITVMRSFFPYKFKIRNHLVFGNIR